MRTCRLYGASKRRREVFREKFILIMIAGLAAICCSIILSVNLVKAHGNTMEEPTAYKYYKSIEVESGDTLWDIAETYRAGHYDSTQSYVDELKEINGLDSDTIHDGRYLTVAYYEEEFR